jgi:transketolase
MVKTQERTTEELVYLSRKIRLTALEMIHNTGSGHPGPSLSVADILTVLYFSGLTAISPEDPARKDRDRIILSKGHGAPALYAALAEAGYFERRHLTTFRKLDTILQGHPDMKETPGVDMTSGALGNGLSAGIGMAMAAGFTGSSYRVYVVLGDGECQEGQIWEAAMAAATRGCANLTVIIDRNRFNQTGSTERSARLEPFAEKWKAFGWEVEEVDGHDHAQLTAALKTAREYTDRPYAIIARTIKGKGVSFIEGKAEWHSRALSDSEIEQARIELQFERGDWLC